MAGGARGQHVTEPVQPPTRPPAHLRLVDTQPSARSARLAGGLDGAFYRHMVDGMRNGVLAVTIEGELALVNDEALRIFGLSPTEDWLGQPMSVVLAQHPEVIRVLTASFTLDLLPNRAELRLKPSGTVLG